MSNKHPRQQALTVGELCYAIAEGRLPATLHHNQWYQINGRELRRFANQQWDHASAAIPRITHPLNK